MMPEHKEQKPFFRGGERILFVDDEEFLVDIVPQMLKRLGYETVATTSPIEALEIFQSRPQDFDLIIADITMPKMTGEKLAQEILKIRPDIPIILSTGYNTILKKKNAKLSKIADFLMKPFTMMQLATSVQKVLNPK
jgi:DNA-binding NtrC family response regulator